jgi:hypothetical protein
MKSKLTTLALALAALTVSSTVAAKTLVYCSEGSPENFNPQLYTSGTSVDASAVPVYNRLVDFKPGTTELVPSLASVAFRLGAPGHYSVRRIAGGRSILRRRFRFPAGNVAGLQPDRRARTQSG